jgi:hypothetical protein
MEILYEELLNESKWGENKILINEDDNLLQNTQFDKEGYFIVVIEPCNIKTFIQKEIFNKTQKNIELENYHNEINEQEHKIILNSMPYKKNELNEMCDYLEKKMSELLKEDVKIFNDDIWIRICRPSHLFNNDFNPCHRDVYLDFYRNTINIYYPLVGSNENSSLMIQPGSHKWNENETKVTEGGAYFKSMNKKYSVDAIVATTQHINMIRPNPTQNQMMIFSPYLIHGCSNNDNINITRFSLEIRFIKKNRVNQENDFNKYVSKRNWR